MYITAAFSALQPQRLRGILAGIFAGPALLACSGPALEPVHFEDVTQPSGFNRYIGMTHGVAWGDFDGDGMPDVYLTNHLNPPVLLRNLGDGRFKDVTDSMFDHAHLKGDSHGAAWADVNQNGSLDLIQLTGAVVGVGEEPKRLFINYGNQFRDEAEQRDIDNPLGRTRMPLWLDLDDDGRLDLIQGAETRFDDITPPFTFLQQGSRFQQSLEALAFRARGVPFCVVTELDGDHHPELVCRVLGENLTAQVFSTRSLPARELDLLPVTAFEDIAAGDFDNDGAVDLFLARRTPPGAVAFGRPADTVAIADLWVKAADLAQPTEFSFRAKGKLRVVVAAKQPAGALPADGIRIGAGGRPAGAFEFELDPDDPQAAGLAAGAATSAELRIGFEAPDRWQIRLIGPGAGDTGQRPRNVHVQVAVTADEPIRELAAAGTTERPEHAPQRLFMNRGGKLVEESDKRGVNKTPIAAMNVVAADFNNDMLLDLFILGSGDVGMHENLLLLNTGDGRFEPHPLSGGADGPRMGVGDSVTTADVDGDGFIDLLVATGGSMGRSLGLPSDRGVYRLFRNTGNGNRWLQIDLEGTRSNRDGIGARVQVTAGGVTQTRVQDGGIHHRSQNHSRLHFGLASHQHADRIVVQWPSGTTQELTDIGANQVLRITEPTN